MGLFHRAKPSNCHDQHSGKKEISDSRAYWRSCGQSQKQHEPRIPLFVVLHPSWNRPLDLKQIDQLVNPENRADLCGAPEGNTVTKPRSFTSPGSNLPAVAGCASAYTRGPFMNASRLSVLGRIPTQIKHGNTESRTCDPA